MPAFCLHHVSEQCVEREEDCNPGGVIKPNGDLMSSPGACEHNGKTYYTFGAQFSKDYSGFDGTPNCTRTGFLMRKFLNENLTVTKELQSTTDFMDFRYAEILLNFAEAVVERVKRMVICWIWPRRD